MNENLYSKIKYNLEKQRSEFENQWHHITWL